MDTIIHRKRRDNSTLNKDILLTSIRLAVLKFLAEFPRGTTSMLFEFVSHECGPIDRNKFKHTLKKMRNTAGWIFCPDTQFETLNANYKELIYQLTPRGKKLCQELAIPIYPHIGSSSFFHDWMTDHCIASLKLVSLKEPEVNFISSLDILSRIPPMKLPFRFQTEDKEHWLSPDAPPFGLEFGDTHNFFLWETNCGTEDYSEGDNARISLERKIRNYQYLDRPDHNGDNAFYHRLKITNNYVCFTAIDDTDMRAILGAVKRVCGKSPMFLVKVVPHFRRIDYTPQPLHELWYTGWSRAGYPDFYLNTPEEE